RRGDAPGRGREVDLDEARHRAHPDARADHFRPWARPDADLRRVRVRGHGHVPVRAGARRVFRRLRLDQLLHGNDAALHGARPGHAMAATSRTTAHVVERLRALEAEAERYGFFAAVRLIDALHADDPRLGEAARPPEESVRLGQTPTLKFATSTIDAFEAGDGSRPARLSSYFFGLFGPNGPLPLHLTEYAHSRELNFDDPTFRRFADVFHHRLLPLFY